ncbi:MAG: hypothetical protein AB7R67_21825 [Vicinamibacterales bacterium]
MKMRRAGQRRHWVAFQRQTTAATATGFGGDWPTYAEGYADVQPAPAGQGERPIAFSTDAAITHLVETDYVAGVRVKDRVHLVDEGTVLYVVGVPQNVEMRGKTMVVPCEERAA